MLRCVAGGVQDIYFDVANHPAIAILNQHHICLMGILIFPVGIAHIAQVDGRAGRSGQFTTATDKVGMNVGLGDVGNAQPLFGRCFQIGRNIPFRVHYQRFASFGATD